MLSNIAVLFEQCLKAIKTHSSRKLSLIPFYYKCTILYHDSRLKHRCYIPAKAHLISYLSAKMDVYTAPGVLSCLQAINNKLAERRYRRVYDRKANGCDTVRVGKCCLEVSVDILDIPTTCRVRGDLLHLSLLQCTGMQTAVFHNPRFRDVGRRDADNSTFAKT